MKIWALRKVELRMGSISIKCIAEGFTKHEASSFLFALYILVLYWAKKIMFVATMMLKRTMTYASLASPHCPNHPQHFCSAIGMVFKKKVR